jgi:glycogen debranching enzyme
VPSILSEENRTGDGPAPILSWAVWRIYEATHDDAFLKAVNPACARLNRFWFETQDRNHNGLPEWRSGGQIADNSPRWDKDGKVRVNLNMGEFESPDLAGFLLMDLRCLARMARTLGNAEEAKSWEQKATALASQVVAKMHFQADNAFGDIDIASAKPWNRAVTLNMFIPLWAGVPLSQPQTDAVIRTHMLNAEEMNGKIPFPSVAYNDKNYDSLGYWRGIMWPHFVYWMVEALQKAGYPEAAQRVADRARLTFTGFLNHATPLYSWREEQPLRGSVFAGYIGDMPHNWASAECILYLRHMLALEDGPALRLLAGIGDFELTAGEPYALAESPTRFGRITLDLEPLDRHQGWQLKFERGTGPAPATVQLSANLGSRLRFVEVTGASIRRQEDAILVDPEATSWAATWRA